MNRSSTSRAFTSWKLDILNALSVDTEVTDLDFRVAYRIMSHINSVSRLAWPSVARLAAQMGKSEDRIRASTRRLQAAGWLLKQRRSQKAPNEYTFLCDRVNAVVDGMLARVEALESGSDDHADLHGQKSGDRAELRGRDHADLHGPDHADLHGKHLKKNYLHITPSIPGSELSEVTYTREGVVLVGNDRVPIPIPENDGDAIAVVEKICRGVDVHPVIKTRLKSMLFDGVLTVNLALAMIGKREEDAA